MLDTWVKSRFWSNNGAYVYVSVWICVIFGILLCVQRVWDISTHASSFSVDLFFPRFVCSAWTVLNNSFFILLNGIFYVILWILCLHVTLHAFSVIINCAYHRRAYTIRRALWLWVEVLCVWELFNIRDFCLSEWIKLFTYFTLMGINPNALISKMFLGPHAGPCTDDLTGTAFSLFFTSVQ